MDAWEFCRAGKTLSGSGDSSHLASWARLYESLHNDVNGRLVDPGAVRGEVSHEDAVGNSQTQNQDKTKWQIQWQIQWQIKGHCNADGQCSLHLSGQLNVPLVCMRCNGPVASHLTFDRRLRLCKSEQEADTLETDEDEDAVAASGQVDLMQWLEDEFLLSLPMFPAHAESECEAGECKAGDWVAAYKEINDIDELSDVSAVTDTGEGRENSPPAGKFDKRDRASGKAAQTEVHRPFEALGSLLKKNRPDN